MYVGKDFERRSRKWRDTELNKEGSTTYGYEFLPLLVPASQELERRGEVCKISYQ